MAETKRLGGARAGVGRKSLAGAQVGRSPRITVALAPADLATLDAMGGTRSDALRSLIEQRREQQGQVRLVLPRAQALVLLMALREWHGQARGNDQLVAADAMAALGQALSAAALE